MKEPRVNKKQHKKLDVLYWWKENCNQFFLVFFNVTRFFDISITAVLLNQLFAFEIKILFSIDLVFCQRMKKLWFTLKANYMDLKIIFNPFIK